MGKFLLDIPDKLHKELKHYSIDVEKDMRDIIIEAIRDHLEVLAVRLPTIKIRKEPEKKKKGD